MQKARTFALGTAAGIGITLLLGAAAVQPPPQPLRPVQVRLDRWDMKPGKEAEFKAWMDYLHQQQRKSVASMSGERNYFEAMFTSPDEPNHLYWIMVTGEGGATPSKPPADLDQRHFAYMKDVVVKGSYRAMKTQEVIAPDFIVAAVREQQEREK